MGNEKIIELMETAVTNKDAIKYAKHAEKLNISRVEGDFWRELFYSGERIELEYWISHLHQYKPHISEIMLIPEKYDDLFYKGLQVCDLTNAAIDDDIENLKERIGYNISEECVEKRLKALNGCPELW